MLYHRYPKLIVGVWLFLLVLSSSYAYKLPSILKGPGLTINGSYSQVQEILSQDFHIPNDPIILVFEKKDSISNHRFESFIAQTLTLIKQQEGLKQLISPLQTKGMIKGNWAYAILSYEQKPYEMGPVILRIRSVLPQATGMSVKVTGKSAIQQDVNVASQMDLRKSEMIGVPIALGVLIFAFGGIRAAVLTLVVGWMSVAGAMGMMYWLGTIIDLSIFVLNVIPMVGLALSVDFALLMISRFREELHVHDVGQALGITLRTAGRSILLSGVCVFFGLAATWLIPMPIFQTVSLGAMVVLFFSILVNLTFLPSLLFLMGTRLGTGKMGGRQRGGLWGRLACFMMKRPLQMVMISLLPLVSFGWQLLHMNVVVPDARTLPKSYESRIADEFYRQHFTTSGSAQVILLSKLKDLSKTYDFIQHLQKDPMVAEVDSIFSTLRLQSKQVEKMVHQKNLIGNNGPLLGKWIQNDHMLITVTLKAKADSAQAFQWLRGIDQQAEISLLIGGEPRYQQEIIDGVLDQLGDVLLLVFITNYAVLFIAYRSVLIPIKTIAMNLLSLSASLGVLTWFFEQGGLGLEPSGIAIIIPVFIFGLVFGISMDYGVFLISRIYEIYQQTGNNDRAVIFGLTSTSRIITSAAAIMIAVTGSFATAGVVPMKQLGIGIATAILVDATLIRMILVPALMKLLGSWNWWSPFSKKPPRIY